MQETWVRSLGWEDPTEKGKATHSSILAWRSPWTVYSPLGCKELDMTEQISLVWIYKYSHFGASLVAQKVKNLPATWETQVRFLGLEDPLEKEMATHSTTLAWKIPWTEEPGRLQSMGSKRVRHNWATSLSLFSLHLTIRVCVYIQQIEGLTCKGEVPSSLWRWRLYAAALWQSQE